MIKIFDPTDDVVISSRREWYGGECCFRCQWCRIPVLAMRLDDCSMIHLSMERCGGDYVATMYFRGFVLGFKSGNPGNYSMHHCLLDWPLYRLFRLKVFCARLRSKWNL